MSNPASQPPADNPLDALKRDVARAILIQRGRIPADDLGSSDERDQFDWPRHARLNQLPPPGRWQTWLIRAGRGFGKTRAGAEWVRAQIESGRCKRMHLVAPTSADVRDTMVEGVSGILSVCPPWNRPVYEPSKRRLTWPNGSVAILFSSEEPDRLRGPQCLVAETPVLMADGSEKALASVRVGDSVATRSGPRRVLASWLTKKKSEVYRLSLMDGRDIIGTGDHRVFAADRGFVPIASLSPGDRVCVTVASNGAGTGGTRRGAVTTCEPFVSIKPSGSGRTARFRLDSTFTTRTRIRRTTGLKTSNSSRTPTITGCTFTGCTLIRRRPSLTRKRLSVEMKPNDSSVILSASSAVGPFTVDRSARRASVRLLALKPRGPALSRPTHGCVNTAADPSQRRGVSNVTARNAATLWRQQNALQRSRLGPSPATTAERGLRASVLTRASVSTPARSLSTLTIVSVERSPITHDVFDINVEGAHEFFANGILVHNCDGAWADELAAWKRPETWDQLLFGLRLGENPQVCVTTTPRPTKIIKDLLVSPTTVETRGTTYENRDNLAPAFFERIVRQYEGTRLGRQEIEAVILDDNPGALWQRGTIERGRVTQPPVLTRIVVAIDPSGSSSEGAAEAGIVCAGKGVDGQGYVLSDRTLRGTPREWASEAVAEYHARQADRIVAEVNYGGEMVRMTVQTIDASVPYKEVRASRGKQVRAEPIAALYEQSRVHHVGALPQLEDECCEWEPGAPSPNRMDALVWALTELMLDPAASDYASGYAFTPQSNPHTAVQQPRVPVRSGGGYAF